MEDTKPKKALGQHWLEDVALLEAMCDAAGVVRGDVVLEIGPGLGTLTDRLIERGAEVVALEYDQDLITGLHAKYDDLPASTIFIQEGDVRTYDFGNMPDHYKIVANIPYYLTSHLIRSISETANPPQIAALLVQKEVAERVAAAPGDMSLLSVSAQFYWDVTLGPEVPARLFTPPPKVDSQILVLAKRAQPLFMDVDAKQFFRIVKAGYSARRKTLLNALSGGLRLEKAELETYLTAAGLDGGQRAQNLSLDDWHKLYQAIPR